MTEDQTIEQVAGDNVGDWMRQAIQNIDAEFGDGFAKAHPELVGSMIQASAIDSGVAYIHNLFIAPSEEYPVGEEYPHEE